MFETPFNEAQLEHTFPHQRRRR